MASLLDLARALLATGERPFGDVGLGRVTADRVLGAGITMSRIPKLSGPADEETRGQLARVLLRAVRQ